MDKQALIDKLEKEYEDFIAKISVLPVEKIISRVNVIEGMRYVLEYVRGEDFELSKLDNKIDTLNLDENNSLLADIYETFVFELDERDLHDYLNIAMDVVFEEMLFYQSTASRQDSNPSDEENEDELEP